MLHRSRELVARDTKARVGGVERYLEGACDFRHGISLDFVKDEHGPPIEIESFERRPRELERLASCCSIDGGCRRVGHVREVVADLDPVASEAPVVGGRAVGEAEQPRANGAARVIAIEMSMNEDEHVVGHVLEIARVHPEPAECEPDVVELPSERGLESDGCGCGHFLGGGPRCPRRGHVLPLGRAARIRHRKLKKSPVPIISDTGEAFQGVVSSTRNSTRDRLASASSSGRKKIGPPSRTSTPTRAPAAA